MKSSQEIYKSFIKNEVAPNLRNIGFKGSGQNYFLPSERNWQLMSFQKSMFSDADEISFTINILVVDKEEWDKARMKSNYFPKQPSATTYYGVGNQKRIGKLIPGNKDIWWKISHKTKLNNLANEILETINKYILPEMKK